MKWSSQLSDPIINEKAKIFMLIKIFEFWSKPNLTSFIGHINSVFLIEKVQLQRTDIYFLDFHIDLPKFIKLIYIFFYLYNLIKIFIFSFFKSFQNKMSHRFLDFETSPIWSSILPFFFSHQGNDHDLFEINLFFLFTNINFWAYPIISPFFQLFS